MTFSQFGGPGNSNGTDGSLTSVDFSTWDINNSALDLLPEVTDWTTASQDDLSLSTETITAVGAAQVGPIERSGRTSGYSSGDVLETNVWFRVSGFNGDDDYRLVHGFVTDAYADHGDSGGPFWQGSTAVGVLSAGTTTEDGTVLSFGADIADGLALSGGYTLKLHIDAPAVKTTGTVVAGDQISGTAPAGTTVEVTPAGGATITATSDASGNWSFPAPADFGAFDFSVIAKNGFNVSEAASGSVTIAPAAPAILSPADGSTVIDEVTEISGTGVAGATVTLDGDLEPKAGVASAKAAVQITVAADGTWSAPVALGYGSYGVTASQTAGGVTSALAGSKFSVVPVAPVITAPAAGSSFTEDALPETITGTGTDGATITVAVDGTAIGSAVVADGKWTLDFPADLAAGAHTIAATQTIDGSTSAAAEIAVTINALIVVEPSQTPTATSVPTKAPGGSLAATGATDSTPLVLGGVGLLIAGAALFIARRLRLARR